MQKKKKNNIVFFNVRYASFPYLEAISSIIWVKGNIIRIKLGLKVRIPTLKELACVDLKD